MNTSSNCSWNYKFFILFFVVLSFCFYGCGGGASDSVGFKSLSEIKDTKEIQLDTPTELITGLNTLYPVFCDIPANVLPPKTIVELKESSLTIVDIPVFGSPILNDYSIKAKLDGRYADSKLSKPVKLRIPLPSSKLKKDSNYYLAFKDNNSSSWKITNIETLWDNNSNFDEKSLFKPYYDGNTVTVYVSDINKTFNIYSDSELNSLQKELSAIDKVKKSIFTVSPNEFKTEIDNNGNEFYSEDAEFRIMVNVEKFSDILHQQADVELSFNSANANKSNLLIDGKHVVENVTDINVNGLYSHRLSINSLSKQNIIISGLTATYTFNLGLKGINVKDFPSSSILNTTITVGDRISGYRLFAEGSLNRIKGETIIPDTETSTDTGTVTETNTSTDTGTATETSTSTDTATATETITSTDTGTVTETITSTDTATATETITSTDTATSTETETSTDTDVEATPEDFPTVSSIPADNAVDVLASSSIDIVLSEDIVWDAGTTSKFSLFDTVSSTTVEIAVSYGLSPKTIHIVPASLLNYLHDYEVRIEQGILSSDHTKIYNPKILHFKTVSRTTTTVTEPSFASGNCIDGKLIYQPSITINFSRPVADKALAGAAITVKDSSDIDKATKIWNSAGNSLTLTFTDELDADTEYTISMESGIKDIDNYDITPFASQQFTTLGYYNVSSSVPSDGALDITVDSQIKLTFTENLVWDSSYKSNIRLYKTSDSSLVDFNCSYSAGQLTITPVTNLAYETDYTVEVLRFTTNVKKVDNYSSHFKTVARTPTTGTVPAFASGNLVDGKSVYQPIITLNFSRPVANKTLAGNAVTVKDSSDVDKATKSWNAAGDQLTLTFDSELEPSTTYTVSMTTGVKDTDNYDITPFSDYQFTTLALINISSTVPSNGATGVAVDTTVTLNLSEGIIWDSSYKSNIRLYKTSDSSTVDFNCSYSAGNLVITPIADLDNETEYTLSVQRFAAGARTIGGLDIGFTTVAAIAFAGGSGTSTDPYIVATAEQFDSMRNDLTAYYKLSNNINVATDTYTSETNTADNGWLPIGTSVSPFNGKLDGNGMTISGLKIVRPSDSDISIFGVIGSSGNISNLIVDEDVYIQGYEYVGSIASKNNGTISNITNKSKVKGYRYIGGIAGGNYNIITKCSTEVNARTEGRCGKLGGIAGENDSSLKSASSVKARITMCRNKGIVYQSSSNGTSDGYVGTGGITGCNVYIVENCYNTGDVTAASGLDVGGLVGSNYLHCSGRYNSNAMSGIRCCYSIGEVKILGGIYTSFCGGVAGTTTYGGERFDQYFPDTTADAIINCFVTPQTVINGVNATSNLGVIRNSTVANAGNNYFFSDNYETNIRSATWYRNTYYGYNPTKYPMQSWTNSTIWTLSETELPELVDCGAY